MAKKTTREQLEKVVNNVDESKETVLVIHFDWETSRLSLCAAGNSAHLAAMVGTTLEEDPSENPVTKALLTGFATVDHLHEGRVMHLVREIENKMDDHSELPK